MRIILLFLVIITIFWLIKRLFFKPSIEISARQGEILVQCSHCQTHIPKSSAVFSNEKYYCNQEHADKG